MCWRWRCSKNTDIRKPAGCASRARRRGFPGPRRAFAAARRRSANIPRRCWARPGIRPPRSPGCALPARLARSDVIASAAKQSPRGNAHSEGDCFVAALLAMTVMEATGDRFLLLADAEWLEDR